MWVHVRFVRQCLTIWVFDVQLSHPMMIRTREPLSVGLWAVDKCAENIPQMAVWGMRKRGFRASEHGRRGGVFGCRGQRNGVHRPCYTPPKVRKREKEKAILQILGLAKRHHF